MGNDLDHYWPFEFGFARSRTLTLLNAAGATSTITRAPITYSAWQALGDVQPVDFRTGTAWRALDHSTALLTVRSFVNYRTPVSVDSLYSSVFNAIRALGITQLVVDLRSAAAIRFACRELWPGNIGMLTRSRAKVTR